MEERTIPRTAYEAPQRQPKNAPADISDQNSDGFARFLKKHSSPTHQRVTAGGRIVPMNPKPAPEFKLIIDDLKDLTKEIRNNTAQFISRNKIAIPSGPEPAILDSAKPVNISAPPPIIPAPHQNVMEPINASEQRDAGGRRRGMRTRNRGSRPADLSLEDSNFIRPQQNFTAAADIGAHQLSFPPPPVTNAPFPQIGYAYGNASQSNFIATGDNQPSFPVLSRSTGPLGTGFDVQQSGNQNFSAGISPAIAQDRLNFVQTHVTPHGTGPSMQGNVPVGNSMMLAGGSMMSAPLPVSGLESGSAIPITDDMVRIAQKEFNDLDMKMRGQDGYTAQFIFDPQVAAYYGRERAKIAEQRDWARRKLNMLRNLQEQKKEAEREAERQKRRAPVNFPASTPNKSGTYFNAQAAAWVPNNSTPHRATPHRASPADGSSSGGSRNAVDTNTPGPQPSMAPDMGVIPISADYNYGYGNPAIDRVSYVCPGVRVVKDNEGQASIDFAVPFTPGPYWRKSCGGPAPSESEIDEWGARRGNPPSTLHRVQQCQEMFMRELERQKEKGGSIDQAIIHLRRIMHRKSSSSTPDKAVTRQESATKGGKVPSIILNDGNAAPNVDSPQSHRASFNRAPIHPGTMSPFDANNANTGKSNVPWPVHFTDLDSVYGPTNITQQDFNKWQGPPFMPDAKELARRRDVIESIHAACKPPAERRLDDSTKRIQPGLNTAVISSGGNMFDAKEFGHGKEHGRHAIEADMSKTTHHFEAPKVQKAEKTRVKTTITPWNFTHDSAQVSNKTASSVSLQSVTADRLVPNPAGVSVFDGGMDRHRFRAVETCLNLTAGRRQQKAGPLSAPPFATGAAATSQVGSPPLRSVAELNTPSVQNAQLA